MTTIEYGMFLFNLSVKCATISYCAYSIPCISRTCFFQCYSDFFSEGLRLILSSS